MFGKAGLGGLMKQAQQMQENMKKAQAKLAETEVEGEAGNGLVKVVNDLRPRRAQTRNQPRPDSRSRRRQRNARRFGARRHQRRF